MLSQTDTLKGMKNWFAALFEVGTGEVVAAKRTATRDGIRWVFPNGNMMTVQAAAARFDEGRVYTSCTASGKQVGFPTPGEPTRIIYPGYPGEE